MILEMLSHRTPPSCVAANILTIAELLNPDFNMVKELPSLSFIRECRSVNLHLTKTMSAYTLAKVKEYSELFSDGTSRRQTSIQNLIIGFLEDGGFKTVALSTSILAEDDTATSLNESILRTFKEGQQLLDQWRETTKRMFPGRDDILDLIPKSIDLTLAKLGRNGMVMTDTCRTAQKFRRLLVASIEGICLEAGMSPDEIKMFEGDCWHHLRNIWFGAVIKQLNKSLSGLWEQDLDDIPNIFRVCADINDLLRCIEKEFGRTANYAKGHGSMFEEWMRTNHPGAYLYPIQRACGGARQDIGVEGAPAVLMNLPYYLEFLHWRMSCGLKSEAILQRKLYWMLRSVECVSLLHVLSILHIAVCLPTRWLSANTRDLAEYGFGYFDLGKMLDLFDDAFEKIMDDGSLFLDEDFMMKILEDLEIKIDPFKEYVAFMFEEKKGNLVGGCTNEEDKVMPFDLLRAALFYPTRQDIM